MVESYDHPRVSKYPMVEMAEAIDRMEKAI